jgi:allophanate hydrolase
MSWGCMTAALRARSLAIADLSAAYRAGHTTPAEVLEVVYERIAAFPDRGIWITVLPRDVALARAEELTLADSGALPLYGIPFALKDNMDLFGAPTTAACPAYAYTAGETAPVIERLLRAGAIPIGKTNLDQFATGLAGVRTPYGPCRNSFNPEYISGGSSAGSAVAVALGLASFALGTDTAGSGRVPAAFNNLIGLKPSCGRLSIRGIVPCSRTIDTVSILALTAEDAARVCRVAQGFDPADPYSRRIGAAPRPEAMRRSGFRFGMPQASQLRFLGNSDYPGLFDAAVARLQRLGGVAVPIDFSPLAEASALFYQGPWVAERYIVIEEVLRRAPQALHPIVRQVIENGARIALADSLRAQYRLQALRRIAAGIWEDVDMLVTPTVATHYRIAEIEADPVGLNLTLGYYTNYMNLMDLAGVAVPAGFTRDALPFGVTLVGPTWSEFGLLELAARLQHYESARLGAQDMVLSREPHFDWSAYKEIADEG